MELAAELREWAEAQRASAQEALSLMGERGRDLYESLMESAAAAEANAAAAELAGGSEMCDCGCGDELHMAA
jgi:hypothetical protein